MNTVNWKKDKRNKNKPRQNQIVIVDSALDVIRTECDKWKAIEEECSGSLIGKWIKNKCFIFYAVRTGYFAQQSFGGVTTDVEYQNKVFDVILNEYSKTDLIYLGDYHSHPMYLPTLSDTDERTSWKILSSPKHQNISKVTILLLTYSNGHQEIYPYLVSGRESNNGYGQISIAGTGLGIIKSEARSVRGLLKKKYINIDTLTGEMNKETDLPGEKKQEAVLLNAFYETPFYKIPVLKERFIKEIGRITELFNVDVTPTYTDNGVISVEFKVKGIDIHIFFPREYPLNPPTILFGSNQGELFEFSSRKNWNSMSNSTDLLEELFEQKGGSSYGK